MQPKNIWNSYFKINPSFISINVSARLINSLLWLTISIVVSSFSLSSTNKLWIFSLFTESRFPVGSSAKIILGSLIKARAIAILCCSPPDSSAGL